MYSNKSEYDRRWQYGDRNPRDDGNTRWKERPGAHGDTQRGSYHKFTGQAHTSAERTSGSKEYSDSPQRPYYKEQANRERSRKSPARRRPSSEEWSVSEKRRRRYTEEEEADFRYRYESEDKIYKYSPEDTARTHASKDFKRVTPPEEDFKYRMTSQEPRPRQQHEDFTYRHEAEDFNYRRPLYKDRDGQERSRDHSAERTRPQEFPTKSSAKAREKHYSPTDREDHQPRTRFPLNGSRSGEVYERDVSNTGPAVPDQKTKGFQRFLDVLNKGVDISALKKFAKPSSSGVDHQPPSPASHSSATDQPCAPSWQRKRRTPENSCTWSQSKGSGRDVPPLLSHRSFSPEKCSPSHEKSHQRSEAEGSHLASNSRSRSPSEVEKRTMTPEEEHKHRQMQDVLHAIGMDLGYEELGQMSSRIQERLYGKKDGDRSRRHKDHRENTRRTFSPQRRSRSLTSSSSSSRSNYSPVTQGDLQQNDSYMGKRDVIKATEANDDDYAPQMSSSISQDTGRSDNSQESSVSSPVCSLMPTFPTYSTPAQPPVPLMQTYPPVHYSPYSLYPPPSLPSAIPPTWAPVVGRPLLPSPFFPFPHAPQLNIHPALLAQVSHAFPQPAPNYPPPFVNVQDANKQKAKTQSRPRCLQVIDTQQTG